MSRSIRGVAVTMVLSLVLALVVVMGLASPVATVEASGECAALGGEVRAADIEFDGPDGLLPARVWAPDASVQSSPCPILVLLPGACATLSTVAWAGPRLASLGYVVMAATISAGGASTERCNAGAVAALNAVTSMVNPFLADSDVERIGMAGWSLGGRTLVRTQAEDPRVDAIVVWDNLVMSESGDAGSPSCVNSPDVIREARVPAMGQASETCPTFDYDVKTLGFEHWRAAGQASMQLVFSDSTHYWWGATSTDQQQRISTYYTAAWFDRYLKNDPSATERLMADVVDGIPVNELLSSRFRSAAAFDGIDCVDLRNACVAPPPAPPSMLEAPSTTGTASVGYELAATTGTWAGNPTEFAFQWSRCSTSGGSCSPIPEASTDSYVVVDADTGSRLAVTVTASSEFGSGSATSPLSAVIAEPGERIVGTAEWAQRAGSPSQVGSQLVTDIFRGIDTDPNGDVVGVGTFGNTATLSGSSSMLVSAGSSDVMVVKYSPTGEVRWAQRFGGANADNAYNMALDADGNIYVVGTWVGSITVGSTIYRAGANTRPFVMKLDSDGNPIWFRPLLAASTGPGTTVASEVVVDADQNVVVSGSVLSGETTWAILPATQFPAPTTQAGFVVRLDSQARLQWVSTSSGSGITNFRTLGLSGTTLAVGGTFNDTLTLGSTPTLTTRGGNDGFAATMDASTGAWLNAAQLGGPGDDEVRGVDTLDGDFVWGGKNGPDADIFGSMSPNAGGIDVFVARAMLDATPRWVRWIGATRDDEGAELAVGSDGRVIVGGAYSGTLRFAGRTVRSGDFDILVAAYTATGDELWVSDPLGSPAGGCISGFGCNDFAYDVAASGTAAYFGGFFQATGVFGPTSLASVGREDAVIGRIGAGGVAPPVIPAVVRTPDDRFEGLSGYEFQPHYLEVPSPVGPLRMHYLDEGPDDGPVVLLTHGLPAWSYLYRSMIPQLTAQGYRVIAPDFIGFGRSDKPTDQDLYTLDQHVQWLQSLVDQLELTDTTLVLHDSGGMIGLRLAAIEGDRFSRLLVLDTSIPAGDVPFSASQRAGFDWFRIVLSDAPDINTYVDDMVQAGTSRTMTGPELAGYLAPFPSEEYVAGLRKNDFMYPVGPGDPGAEENAAARSELATNWDKPVKILFSSSGNNLNPGALDVFRTIFAGDIVGDDTLEVAKHYLQEDAGADVASQLIEFISTTDDHAPTVSLTTPADGTIVQRGSELVASYTCSDIGGSGLASCEGPVPSGEQIDTSIDGRFTFTVTAIDAAGNDSRLTGTYTVDGVAPTILVSTPNSATGYIKGTRVNATFDCNDSGGAGVASCVGTVASGARIATNTVGVHTFSVTATDTVGNQSDVDVPYLVWPAWVGTLCRTIARYPQYFPAVIRNWCGGFDLGS